MSRPEKPIDWELVDELLLAGCTGIEIAPNFDMHYETFYDRVRAKYNIGFTEYCSLKRSQGDSILRKVQYDKAASGDNTQLIWLGKNRLKQSENPQEVAATQEIATHFKGIMDQLSSLQSQRKIADTSIENDNKS